VAGPLEIVTNRSVPLQILAAPPALGASSIGASTTEQPMVMRRAIFGIACNVIYSASMAQLAAR
jgi:hypothetical protein